MVTMYEEKITEITNFHETMLKLILVAGAACVVMLTVLGFSLAAEIARVTTFIAGVGNKAILRWRFRQAPIRAFSYLVNEIKNRFKTNEP